MKFGIVADSSSDITDINISNKDIDFSLVSLKLAIGDQEYEDDQNLDIEKFLYDMENATGELMTRCPAPADFQEAYSKSDNVFCFTISSKLSGTYNSAELAKKLVDEEHTGKNIFVLDSLATAGNIKMLVEKTIELIDANLEYEEICKELLLYRDRMYVIFTLGNYTMLIKNGRMSAFAGSIASTLNIRVIANAKEGAINVIKKVRGINKCYSSIVEEVNNYTNGEVNKIFIHHCFNEEGAKELARRFKEYKKDINIEINKCRGLTSFYSQRGGIIVGFAK